MVTDSRGTSVDELLRDTLYRTTAGAFDSSTAGIIRTWQPFDAGRSLPEPLSGVGQFYPPNAIGQEVQALQAGETRGREVRSGTSFHLAANPRFCLDDGPDGTAPDSQGRKVTNASATVRACLATSAKCRRGAENHWTVMMQNGNACGLSAMGVQCSECRWRFVSRAERRFARHGTAFVSGVTPSEFNLCCRDPL